MENIMKKTLVTLASLAFSALSFAAMEITKYKGEVKLAGVAITKIGPITATSGLVETSAQSFIQIKVDDSGSLLTVGPKSKIELQEQKSFTHEEGQILYKYNKKSEGKAKVVVKTKTAALGVRGTEFMVVANSLLGETEIITFEGSVIFQSISDSSDKKLIKDGQWGGIGGRFGKEIGDVMDLPTNVLDAFKSSFNF
jgi:ferric-dicitrate binding protein FerR (iron transport regulator)